MYVDYNYTVNENFVSHYTLLRKTITFNVGLLLLQVIPIGYTFMQNVRLIVQTS